MNDEVIPHVFNPVLSSKSQTFEEKKRFYQKIKTILNYLRRLKMNNPGALIK